jgi:soluble lytic murein transglycosylase-like protein
LKDAFLFGGVGLVVAGLVIVAMLVQPPANLAAQAQSSDQSSQPASSVGDPAITSNPRTVLAVAGSGWAHGLALDQMAQRLVGVVTPTPPPTQPTPIVRQFAATAAITPTPGAAPTVTVATVPTATASASLGPAVPSAVSRWSPIILHYSQASGLDPNLVAAVMVTESNGNPNATSSKGAIGLMQVMGGSYDPDANISQGISILASDLQHFNGDLELALAAYNAGANAVDRYQGIPPYLETENYVFLVLNRYYLYSAT